jgi:hypothetical protein
MIQLKRIRWAGYLAHAMKKRSAHRTVAGRPEEMSAAGRSTRTWEDKVKWVINIEMAFADCINVAQVGGKWQTVVNTGMNLLAP